MPFIRFSMIGYPWTSNRTRLSCLYCYHAYYLMGQTYFKQKNYQQASQMFSSIPGTHPEYVFAQHSLAITNIMTLNMEDALNALGNCIEAKTTYLQTVLGYLAPPIFVVFFLGVFWKRLNAKGALWAMIVGFILGISRMAIDTPVSLGVHGFQYAHGSILWIINNSYFQYFSVLITIISAIVMVGVRYMTAALDYGRIKNLTLATTTREDKAISRASWTWKEVAFSAVVLVGILAGYLYFRG